MKIYVQSRGKPQNKDYTWLKSEENHLYREIPPILKRISIAKLIDSRKYSIVVARDDGELVLLVTGLSSQRNDFMNRQIRNSVAWVVDDNPENEKIIRSLAVCVLTDREKVENEVNEAVNETEANSDYEFNVNSEKINQLSDIKVESYSNPNEDNYIGSYSIELQQEIGLELQTNPLPNRDGILVLLTSLKTESALKEYKVWRGLSAKVSSNELTPVYSNSQKQLSKKKTGSGHRSGHRSGHNSNIDQIYRELNTIAEEMKEITKELQKRKSEDKKPGG
ncbi:MAG: hypothetical protein ACLFM2_05510 [Halothece sp.]